MSSSLVWIQLYYDGEDEPVGNPIFVKTASLDPPVVAALIEAVKKKLNLDAPLHRISVYPPKSSGDESKYKSGKNLEDLIEELEKEEILPTSDDHPLTLVAPQQQSTKTLASNSAVKSMDEFFNQNLENLKPRKETADGSSSPTSTSRWIGVRRMMWFDKRLRQVYWRHCYSYILCTTIAFFENHYDKYKEALDSNQSADIQSMVLTGVQGTGKSVIGAIIGLFMSKAFGWRVTYEFSGSSYTTNGQDADKHITICDLSIQEQYRPRGFALLVSSANKNRWHDLQQQQAWSFDNYCFIDVPCKSESEKMSTPTSTGASIAEKFEIVGGVPRLHNSYTTVDQCKELIDTIIASINLLDSTRSLSNLNDAALTPGTKFYPGLVGHVVPVDRFRNTFMIEAASHYVESALYAKEKEKSEADIKSLLNELIGIPKARSFAGWIWEPLFSQQIHNRTAPVTIVGAQLPMTSSSKASSLLVLRDMSKIQFFEFKDMTDFEGQSKELLKNETKAEPKLCAFFKAKSDTYPGIDAIIIMRRSNGKLLVAGQQITVAQTTHPVQEKSLDLLIEACNKLKTEVKADIEVELWFLQPEKSLADFGFMNLQPLTFDKPRLPSDGASDGTSSRGAGKRPSKKRKHYGQFVANVGVGRMQSNDKTYWSDAVREVQQFVGIVRLDDPTADTSEEKSDVVQDITDKLNEIHKCASRRNASAPQDPLSRSWDRTITIFKSLKNHLDQNLYSLFEEDLQHDAQDLEEAGFIFQATSEGGA